jgi:hypothetical protein
MNINLKEIISAELEKIDNQEWISAEVYFDFAPYINRGYAGTQLFHGKDGKLISVFLLGDERFKDNLFKYIYFANQGDNINRIKVSAKKSPQLLVEVITSFEKEIVEKFENNLPKSKRGKTLPWWKNPEEIKKLLQEEEQTPAIQEVVETFSLASLKRHLAQLPVQESPLSQEQLNGKPLQELYKLFDRYLREPTNPLWDGGLINIRKDSAGQFSGNVTQYYYESAEEQKTGRADYKEASLPVITERMRSIYEAIQAETKRLYPDITWDALFISIYPDGFAEANFEYKNEEIELE